MALVSARAARRLGGLLDRSLTRLGRSGDVTSGAGFVTRNARGSDRPRTSGDRPRTRPAGRRALRTGGAVVLGLAALLGAARSAAAVGGPWSTAGWRGDRLTVTYDDGDGHASTRTLACGARVVRSAQEQDACRRLDALGGPLAPVPAGQMCSMIYGGPQTAHVSGLWHGEPVDETYRRTDGCEVARWNRMVPALPSPTAAGGGTRDLAA